MPIPSAIKIVPWDMGPVDAKLKICSKFYKTNTSEP